MLWHSWLGHCLVCLYHISKHLGLISASTSNAAPYWCTWEAAHNGFLPLETWIRSLVLDWSFPSYCRHVGNESVAGKSISHFVSLSSSFPFHLSLLQRNNKNFWKSMPFSKWLRKRLLTEFLVCILLITLSYIQSLEKVLINFCSD